MGLGPRSRLVGARRARVIVARTCASSAVAVHVASDSSARASCSKASAASTSPAAAARRARSSRSSAFQAARRRTWPAAPAPPRAWRHRRCAPPAPREPARRWLARRRAPPRPRSRRGRRSWRRPARPRRPPGRPPASAARGPARPASSPPGASASTSFPRFFRLRRFSSRRTRPSSGSRKVGVGVVRRQVVAGRGRLVPGALLEVGNRREQPRLARRGPWSPPAPRAGGAPCLRAWPATRAAAAPVHAAVSTSAAPAAG